MKLNYKTQKAQSFVYQYNHAASSIYNAYKKPSDYKIKMYNDFLLRLSPAERETAHVWGNTFTITIAYIDHDNVLHVMSPSNGYEIQLEEGYERV